MQSPKTSAAASRPAVKLPTMLFLRLGFIMQLVSLFAVRAPDTGAHLVALGAAAADEGTACLAFTLAVFNGPEYGTYSPYACRKNTLQ